MESTVPSPTAKLIRRHHIRMSGTLHSTLVSSQSGSPGVDGIPPKLLLEIVEQISIPLATVFNLSLEEGIVPLEWKEANIIPLFKKGSRNKSENYRPVSLTSVICKLLERLMLKIN